MVLIIQTITDVQNAIQRATNLFKVQYNTVISKVTQNKTTKKFYDGAIGGVFNIVAFNPFDRALYLSTGKSLHPFKKAYWKNPYQGVNNGIVQRLIGYGASEPIRAIVENILMRHIEEKKHYTVLASIITYSGISLFTSPLSATKATNWNTDHHKKLFDMMNDMYKKGGIQSFFRGTTITIKREIAFGTVVGFLTSNYNDTHNMYVDCAYFGLAAIASSPFNYVRVMIYRSPIENTISSVKVVKHLAYTTKNVFNKHGLFTALKYVGFNKFNIGWGTLRVSIGMAVSRKIYLFLSEDQ